MSGAKVDTKEESSGLNISTNLIAKCFKSNLNITKEQGLQQAKVLLEYIKEEEWDAETINVDLKEGHISSELVSIISESLKLNADKEMQSILKALNDIFSGNSELRDLSALDWTNDTKEKDTRDYINKQCPNMIKDGEDGDLIIVMAVGKKNEIPNLLCLIYDAFTRYRMDAKLKNINKNNQSLKTSQDFCEEHPLCKNLNKAYLKHVKGAINSYESRFIPAYKFEQPEVLYNDSCSVFIHYTIMVAKALRNFLEKASTINAVTPLQVDLLIIPKNLVRNTGGMNNFDSDDDDDDDDDDKDDEEEVKEVETAKQLSNSFEKVMNDKYHQKYTKEDIAEQDSKYWRRLNTLFQEYVNGENRKRISIVIDRRTDPNTIHFYVIPDGKGEIPKDYCATTLVYLSAKFIIPIWDEERDRADKFPFVGGAHAAGKYFVVSFQMMDNEHTRLQWSFFGNGIRLSPKVMVEIWPTVFVDQTLGAKYTEDYVRKEMDLWDSLYEEWVEPQTTS